MDSNNLGLLIRRAFDPVAGRHDLVCQSVLNSFEEVTIQYANKSSFLAVGLAARTPELTVVLGPQPPTQPKNVFLLGDVMRAQHAIDAYFAYGTPPQDIIADQAVLDWLASRTELYGSELFDGDDSVVRLLAEYREWQASEYDVANMVNDARNAAEIAWLRGDYSKVVAKYLSIAKHMFPAEIERLELAKALARSREC